MRNIKGFHILAELYGCPAKKLEKASYLKLVLTESAKKAGFNIVGKSFYQFKPRGATGVVLLASSHISAHTWPEHNFVALDVYSCKGKVAAKKAVNYLIKQFEPRKVRTKEIVRYK